MASDGRLWFGMRSGLLIVDPVRLVSKTRPPPVYIEELYADGIPVPGRSVIPAGTHELKIQFTALDLSAPRKLRFRQRLENYDEEWTEAGSEHVATYTKVPPGDYVFHLMACNSDGVWNQKGASLAFTVAPAWWQTRWTHWSAVLFLLSLVFAFDRRRLRRLERRRAEQEIFARRLIDSQESERRRIASELHDSLGQNLLIIKNRAFIGTKTTASSVVMREQLNEILDASGRSIEEVRIIARGLRPYQLDRLGLTKTLQDAAELVTSSGGPRVTAQVDPVDKIFSPEVEISIYRIVQEGLNNALKHADAKSVRLEVQRESRLVRIKLSDDGKGFDPAQKESFGLIGIKERVQLLRGTLNIDSAPERGTCLNVELPLTPPGSD
jgi:signal transduction histidine kinase